MQLHLSFRASKGKSKHFLNRSAVLSIASAEWKADLTDLKPKLKDARKGLNRSWRLDCVSLRQRRRHGFPNLKQRWRHGSPRLKRRWRHGFPSLKRRWRPAFPNLKRR